MMSKVLYKTFERSITLCRDLRVIKLLGFNVGSLQKWDRITMDFGSGFPRTHRNSDVIWMIVSRLTESAHFLKIGMDYSLERLTE